MDVDAKTIVGALLITAALVKCVGDVAEACRKIDPPKRLEPATANGAPLPPKGNSR